MEREVLQISERIERRISDLKDKLKEPHKKRVVILRSWLTDTLQSERQAAFAREQPWFDRTFRDISLPQCATLADRVFRTVCQRQFGQVPTLRLLDYGS